MSNSTGMPKVDLCCSTHSVLNLAKASLEKAMELSPNDHLLIFHNLTQHLSVTQRYNLLKGICNNLYLDGIKDALIESSGFRWTLKFKVTEAP